jgi:teichoic acid transport system permease protein
MLDTVAAPAALPAAPTLLLEPAARAELYGLSRSGARPTLRAYVRQIWRQRDFILTFATAQTMADYASAKLGQVWQVLTPLLNAGLYYLIFGLLLHTSRGIHHFLGFLVTGVFVFTFTQTAVLSGSRSISGRLGLIRALHFPRACLPIAFTVAQLFELGVALVVMIGIDVASGAAVSWSWLLLIPAMAIQTVFNAGLALIVARIGARTPDISQLMPFLLRAWMYCSGLFYSISTLDRGHAHWLKVVFEVNPGALFMDVVRTAMGVPGGPLPTYAWAAISGWALAVGVIGFIFFWRAEEQYGRG